MRIGIIGAENSHAAAIAKTLNVEKRLAGVRVDCLWGETEEFARKTAETGEIPNIVKTPKEMLGKVDGIVVDHRHAKFHLPAALPFVKKGVPAFIDKPFCWRSAEGREFLRVARKNGAPVTSFSTVPHQKSFAKFVRDIEAAGTVTNGATWGPADLKSPYGGVFFYGIHQVEMALAAFGYDVAKVRSAVNGENATAQLLYPSGRIVTLNLTKAGVSGFQIAACTAKGVIGGPLPMDKTPYLAGIKVFVAMFKTREEPIPHDHLLRPVETLEALARSLKSGKTENV